MAKDVEAKTAQEAEGQAFHEADLFGAYRFKVDAKGRVALPSKFRKVLSTDLIVSRELKDKCLYVFEEESFNRWVEQLFASKFGGYDPSDQLHVMLRTKLKANAVDVDTDSSGRIVLKPELREATGIEKDVVLVGNTGYFEIWDAERYDEQIASIDLGMFYSE